MDVELRRAVAAAAAAAAQVWLGSRSAALPHVARAHSDDDVRGWFRDVVVPTRETWVADAAGIVVGVLVLGAASVDQLYVDPSWWNRGAGSRLVALAKARRPEGLELCTFQVNAGARRFYERHGFVAVELTDGATNEEREPDVRYRWTPQPSTETHRYANIM
jgi:GNAT superfamily N-acetyltransferase